MGITPRQPGGQVEDLSVPVHECMALVERIAASEELRRASRLREFLVYVCTQALEQGVSVIHEQEIGEAVFGRPRSYDTNIDNIVRVNATGLRKRLEHYFAEEGLHEQTIVEIPRGSYTPVFRRRTPYASLNEPAAAVLPPTEEPLAPAPPAQLVPPPSPSASFNSIWPIVSAILLVACIGLLWQNRSLDHQLQRWKSEPALRSFWAEFFASGRETDVVLADTSYSVAGDIMQRTVSLSDYLNYNYMRFAEAATLSPDQRQDLNLVLDRSNGSIGDFRVAQQILALNADPKLAVLKFAREYTTDEAKRNSLVLIGSQTSNPWVSLFANKLNFALQYDPVQRRPFVTNRSPQPGEQAIYTPPDRLLPNTADPPSSGYGVIAYLPGLSGNGKVLILEGTDSQATAATGEFMTSEDSLAAFKIKFPPGPIPSFEILLHTSQLSGTPLHAEIAAFRIYPNTKSDVHSNH